MFSISGSKITNIPNENNKEIYSFVGGKLTCPCSSSQISANIVRGSMERKTDGTFVFSCYLNTGVVNTVSFPSGNISATGTCGSTTVNENNLSFTASSARVYFTQNATEYEERSVQLDLYDYATKCLDRISVPSYTFKVSPANFLALEDFKVFKDNFTLGKRVYIDIGEHKVLKPVAISVSINFEDLTDFTIEFSNKYKTNDEGFSLADEFGQSISMGKTVDSNQFTYSSWVDSGASSSIKNFLDAPLDLAKNAVISSVGQAISWDENGMRFRKWNADHTDYEPEQMWAINNSIAMTGDNWDTAKMAIGKFSDPKHGDVWGVNAGLLAGRKIIGNDFSFECPSLDGKTTQFKFDSNGAQLNNSRMYLQKDGGGKISIDPQYGILLGNDALYTIDDNGNYVMNEANANLWMDSNGIVHSKGMFANGGIIKGGEIYIGGLETATDCKFGVDKLGNILGLETANGLAKIYKDGKVSFSNDVSISGNLSLTGNINLSNGIITWGNNAPTKYQFSIDNINWHDIMQSTDKYRRDSLDGGTTWGNSYQFVGVNGSDANVPNYITETKITHTEIESPTISGGTIIGTSVMGGKFTDYDDSSIYISMEASGAAGFNGGQLTMNILGNNVLNLTGYYSSGANANIFELKPYNVGIIEYNATQNKTYAHGDWEFDGNITGVLGRFG